MELRYQALSRYLLAAGLAYFALALSSVYGLYSRARGDVSLFEHSLDASAREGITLAQALSQPVSVTPIGDQGESITNILRYDYESAQSSLGSLHGLTTPTNVLELLTFIGAPLIGTVYAILVLTFDYKHRTIRLRATRHPLAQLQGAKLVSAVIANVALLAVALLAALPVGALLRARLAGQYDLSVFGEITARTSAGALLTGVAVSLAVVAFFCCLGASLGLVFRRALAPIVIFVVWNLLVPVLTPYDPRNLWSLVGHRAFDFTGTFVLVRPVGLTVPTAAVLLPVMAVAAVALGFLVTRRTSRYAT